MKKLTFALLVLVLFAATMMGGGQLAPAAGVTLVQPPSQPVSDKLLLQDLHTQPLAGVSTSPGSPLPPPEPTGLTLPLDLFRDGTLLAGWKPCIDPLGCHGLKLDVPVPGMGLLAGGAWPSASAPRNPEPSEPAPFILSPDTLLAGGNWPAV